MPLQAGQTKCSVRASQNKPLIVEWTSDERGDLETLVHQNKVVPVRYVGCEMEVLEQCVAPGGYDYVPFTAKHERVTMRDEDDLYANMPIGAAALTAKLAESKQLSVDMTLVGKYESSRSAVWRDELHGQCDGATHVVVGLMTGAFELTAGGEATVGATVGVAGVGAGGKSHAERELLRSDGSDSACVGAKADDKSPPSGCGALLKIELVKLGDARTSAAECPDGTNWNGKTCLDAASTPAAAASVTTVAPATRCTSGAFDATRGCVATGKLVVYAPMEGWAAKDLQQRYHANRAATDASTLKELLGISVALARQTPQEAPQWYQRALEHWHALAKDPAGDALKGANVNYAAEADYSLVAAEADQRLKLGACPASTPGALFGQYEGGQLVTTGKWQVLATDADRIDDKLEHVARTYPAPLWIAVATARRGILYDGLRASMLTCVRGKGVDLFTPKQAALLDKLRASGRQDLIDKANEVEAAVIAAWTKKRDDEATSAGTVAVRNLAQAIVMATAFGVSHDVLKVASARFAALHAALGDSQVRSMLAGRVDPIDPDRLRTLDTVMGGLP